MWNLIHERDDLTVADLALNGVAGLKKPLISALLGNFFELD